MTRKGAILSMLSFVVGGRSASAQRTTQQRIDDATALNINDTTGVGVINPNATWAPPPMKIHFDLDSLDQDAAIEVVYKKQAITISAKDIWEALNE